MISILNLIVFTIFLVLVINVGISTAFENSFAKEEEAYQSLSSSLLSSLDDNRDDMIISEELCPPYCKPPAPIQELPQEQTR